VPRRVFLPVPKGGESNFNVSIYNYRSTAGNPAVLAIVSSAHGTSAQVVEGDTFSGSQKLFFNQKGQRASFVGQRLSDNRKERGSKTTGAMTAEEKQQNAILVIQIPLKQRFVRPSPTYPGDGFGGGGVPFAQQSVVIPSASSYVPQGDEENVSAYVQDRRELVKTVDVESAIIKVGAAKGPFTEINGLGIERDHKFPVRVTLQLYKSTSNGVINDSEIKVIADQIVASREQADFIGSLVVGGVTDRPTDRAPTVPIPLWWDTFWYTYHSRYPHWQKDEARAILFKTHRFSHMTMDEAQGQLLAILNNPTS